MPLHGSAVPIRYVGHNLVFPRHVRQRYPLKAFADWLLAELGVEAQGFSSASAADASRAA